MTHKEEGLSIKQILEQDIIEGSISPGEQLDKAALTRRFKLSRTPIRDALRELATTGLIELRPRRSAIVAKPSFKLLLEIFEVMGEYEGLCGQLAAVRMSRDERLALVEIHSKAAGAASSASCAWYCGLKLRRANIWAFSTAPIRALTASR